MVVQRDPASGRGHAFIKPLSEPLVLYELADVPDAKVGYRRVILRLTA
jgi:hypothetical protein